VDERLLEGLLIKCKNCVVDSSAQGIHFIIFAMNAPSHFAIAYDGRPKFGIIGLTPRSPQGSEEGHREGWHDSGLPPTCN